MLNNLIKGTSYELFIRDYLNKNQNQQSWLWSKTPEKILRDCNIIGEWNEHRLKRKEYKIILNKIENGLELDDEENSMIDLGVDIILKINNEYIFVQCKNYDDNNIITTEKLAGFYSMIIHYEKKGILYYTSKLSKNIINKKECNSIEYIKKEFDNKKFYIDKANNIYNKELNKESNKTNLIENAYDYQIEAYCKISEEFKTKNRAILNLPCGLGKTLISMMIGLNYNQVIIISPLIEYCNQNLERFMSDIKYKDYKGLLINTDGTRDTEEIKKFISSNKKIILSVCYKSCDILYNVLSKLTNYIIIIDEFHNISKNDINGLSENGIGTIIYSNSKILYMSATPRIYSCSDEDDEELTFEFNNELFGQIEYKYEFREAIKINKICDYEVYIPDIYLDNSIFINDIDKEIDISKYSNDYISKCNFLLRAILDTGNDKCIIYAKTHNDAYLIKDTLIKLNEYFSLDMYIDTVLSNDSNKDRKRKLNNFRTFNGISLLISVEILNECIDIVECNSVFFSYECKSRIKVIQRMCRAIRIDKNNPHKIARVFIWCNEYDEITDIITNLKEIDYDFDISKVNIFKIDNNNYQILDREKDSDNKYNLLDNYLIGIKRVLSWKQKFDIMIEYINKNKRAPSANDKDLNIKAIGVFFSKQSYSYKKNIKMMKHKDYYNIWSKFMDDYPYCFESKENKWLSILELVKKFMNENKKRPSPYAKNTEDNTKKVINNKEKDEESENEELSLSKYTENELGIWLNIQKGNFNDETKMFSVKIIDKKKVYNHPYIIDSWNEFNTEYGQYMKSNNDKWITKMNLIKEYIDKNKKTPSCKNKDEDIKQLGTFIMTQNKNFKAKTQIMSDIKYYNLWKDFLKEYSEYFKSIEDTWYENLDKVKEFIKVNKRKPNKKSSNSIEKTLGEWITKQNVKYSNNKMNSNEIYNDYKEFIENI